MSGYVCVRTASTVEWFESEAHYYHEDPAVVLTLDPVQHVWWGRSFRPTPRAMTPSVGEVFRRLANFPTASIADLVTHCVPEPGAPLEPVTTGGDRMSGKHVPDSDGYYRGIDLSAKPAVYEGRPVVWGRWGEQGFGYGTDVMREVAEIILAACDEADAMVSRETELST